MAFRKQYLKNGTNKNNKVLKKSVSKRRRNRSRRTRRSRGSGMFYVETMQFTAKSGSAIKIKVSDLTNRPKSSNFRLRYVQGSFSVATGTDINLMVSTVDLRIANAPVGDGAFVAATGPRLLGLLPRSFKIHNPRSSDWCAFNEVDTVILAEIHLGCIENNGAAKVYGLLHVHVDFGPEMLPDACPAIRTLSVDDPGPSCSQDFEVLGRIEDMAM